MLGYFAALLVTPTINIKKNSMVSEPQSSENSPSDAYAPKVALEKRRLGWFGWIGRLSGIFVILLAIIIPVVRQFAYEIDHGMGNAVLIFGSFFFFISVMIWFVTYHSIPRTIRLIGVVMPLVIGFGLMMVVEMTGFSGEMVPQWRWRGVARKQAEKATDEVAVPPDMQGLSFRQFLGDNRDGKVVGVELSEDWGAHPPEIIWEVPVGGGWAGVAIAEGRLITLEQHDDIEKVVCYRMVDGKQIWSVDAKARHFNVAGGLGPRSTPTIEQGRVYTLGATGILQCIDFKSGTLFWKADLLELAGASQAKFEELVNWGRAASPLIVNQTLVVPLGGDDPKNMKSLIAFDKNTGKELWRSGSDQIGYSSPMLASFNNQQQIVMVNEKTVTGHNPETGEQLWSVDWPGLSNGNASCSQPIPLKGNQLFLSKGYGGIATLLAFERGKPVKKPIWINRKSLRTKFTSPIEHNSLIFGLSDGILECIDATTGEQLWKDGRYGHGQVLLAGNHLLISSESGELVLVKADSESHQEVAKYQLIEGITWNIPSLAGPYVIIRNGTSMACVKLPLANDTIGPSITNQ